MSRTTPPRLLLLGGSGMLGRHLGPALAPSNAVHAPGSGEVDLGAPESIAACLHREQPDRVVIAAGLSRVAECEADPQRSERLNVTAVREIARHAGDAQVVLLSTDAVFDGSRNAFREADPPAPHSVYGTHKAAAETIVRGLRRHLILRSARFYARDRGDGRFIDHVIGRLEAGQTVEAPRDTPGNPTFVEDLAPAIGSLLDRGAHGTWHLAGPPVASLYETAQTVAAVWGIDPERVRPIARDAGAAAPRIGSVLDTSRASAAGIQLRRLRAGLEAIRHGEP